MNERRERVVELSAQIAALRRQLAEREAELDSMIEAGPRRRAPQSNGSAGSIDERALAVLKRSARQMTIAEINERMEDVEPDSLRTALARLASDGEIERVGRGIYQFKQLSV